MHAHVISHACASTIRVVPQDVYINTTGKRGPHNHINCSFLVVPHEITHMKIKLQFGSTVAKFLIFFFHIYVCLIEDVKAPSVSVTDTSITIIEWVLFDLTHLNSLLM